MNTDRDPVSTPTALPAFVPRLRIAVLRLLFAVAFSVALAVAPPCAALRVVDADGQALPGARVEVWKPLAGEGTLYRLQPPLVVTESDAEGAAQVVLPHVDGLLLLVDHPGFAPLRRELPAGSLPPRVRLTPGAVLDGHLRTEDGSHLAGRVCATWPADGQTWGVRHTFRRCAESRDDGDFRLVGLPSGAVELRAEAADHLPLVRDATAGDALDLRLERGVLLHGRVVDDDGDGIGGANVSAGTDGGRGTTDRDGAFLVAVRRLPATVTAAAEGYRTHRLRVGRDDDPEALTLRLQPAQVVSGTLLDADGRPVPGGRVWAEHVYGARRDGHWYRCGDDEGGFRFEPAEPGSYRLRLGAEGFRESAVREIDLAPAEHRDLGVVVLSRGAVVSGRTVDGASGEALAGVAVELTSRGTRLLTDLRRQRAFRAVSGDDGGFEIAGLDAGGYDLRASRDGYAAAVAQLDVEADAAHDAGRLMLDRGAEVSGRLVDRDGAPRGGLAVRLFDAAQSSLLPLAERWSDEAGRFGDLRLAGGRYRLQVAGERTLLSQELEIEPGDEERALELVVGGVELHGVVTRGGEPVAGGFLTLSAALDPGQQRGKILLSTAGGTPPVAYGLAETAQSAGVDGNGRFVVPDAPPGLLWLGYVGDDGDPVTRRVFVADQARAEVRVEIAGALLHGRVVDVAGQGVAAARLRLVADGGRTIARTESAADGGFRFDDVEPGTYLLEARADGFATAARRSVEVGALPTSPVEVTLERGGDGALAVHLRRTDGSPLASAPLTVLDAAGTMYAALATDGAGRRRFDDLPGGDYRLVWSDPVAGTGISPPLHVGDGEVVRFEETLPQGSAVEVTCDLARCAGAALDHLAVYARGGVEIAPFLSGTAVAARFSDDGRLTLGRLSPGDYLLRVWVGGVALDQPLRVSARQPQVVALR